MKALQKTQAERDALQVANRELESVNAVLRFQNVRALMVIDGLTNGKNGGSWG